MYPSGRPLEEEEKEEEEVYVWYQYNSELHSV
jgi:hypothetical protein